MLNQLHHPNFFAVSITAIFAFVHNYDMQYILSLPSLCPPPFLIPTALLFLLSFLSFFLPTVPPCLQLSQRGGSELCFCLMMLCWGERNLTVDILFLLFPIRVHVAETAEAWARIRRFLCLNIYFHFTTNTLISCVLLAWMRRCLPAVNTDFWAVVCIACSQLRYGN